MIRRLPLLAALLAAPLSAGLVLDQPKRMDEIDAYEMVAWAAEGDAQACLDSEPADAVAAGAAIPTCASGELDVRMKLLDNTDLNAADRGVIHVLLGQLAAKRITLGLKADEGVSARVCAATETAVLELGQIAPELIPEEMAVEAEQSRQELAGHLPKCRARFGTPKDGVALD